MEYFIISKGRAESISTSRLLDEKGIRHFIVVEPQEQEAYAETLLKTGKLIVLPKNDQGIVFVRQFVLDYARANKLTHFCMLDDDVKAFGTVKGSRCVKGDAHLLELAAQVFVQNGIAQMGLQYQQFAWCAEKPYNSPTHCDCVSFFNVAKLNGVNYDPFCAMKEDWDFSLQVLKAGRTTAVFNRVWMSVPTMGTNHGGLAYEYASHKDWEAAKRLARKWGNEIVSLKWKERDGQKVIDCKVDWKHWQKKGGK